MQKITIATFDDPSAAEKLKELFLQAGLPAELRDDRKMQRSWFLSQPHAFIQLQVPNENYERAENLYRELDAANDIAVCAAIRCPQCRSSRIQYPQMTRHFILPTLLGHLGFFFGVKRKFYCQQCQHLWADRVMTAPKDAHFASPK